MARAQIKNLVELEVGAAMKGIMQQVEQKQIEWSLKLRQEFIDPMGVTLEQTAYDLRQIKETVEIHVVKIEQSTGAILAETLRKADLVLAQLQERIELAGTIAEDSQQRITEVVNDFNLKYATVENDKRELETFRERLLGKLEATFTEMNGRSEAAYVDLNQRCQVEFERHAAFGLSDLCSTS